MKRTVWLLLALLGILAVRAIPSSGTSHPSVTVAIGNQPSHWPPIWFPDGPTDDNG